MMAAGFAAAGIERKPRRREDVLPGTGAGRAGMFPVVGEGQMDFPVASSQVLPVQLADASEVSLERGLEALGQKGDSVALALAAADDDLVIGKVDTLTRRRRASSRRRPLP